MSGLKAINGGTSLTVGFQYNCLVHSKGSQQRISIRRIRKVVFVLLIIRGGGLCELSIGLLEYISCNKHRG
jgi:hypothetical protein